MKIIANLFAGILFPFVLISGGMEVTHWQFWAAVVIVTVVRILDLTRKV